MSDAVLGGRYRIVRHLARGGMAELYLGHDELLNRPVAVKVLFAELAEDRSFVERFRREARSAALLNHPNIVSVYDFGEAPEGYFIIMEYVAGQPLSEIIATGGALAPSRAAAIAADVAAALGAAHREGIIHRDVKPANVLIADGVTKVADFGIAQAVETQDRLTMPGAVMGTAIYLSPEQAQGLAVDQRSDLYSLGLVLYQMLTGQPAFSGDSLLALAFKQQHEPPPAPSALNPSVPGQLDALVAKALAIDPARRPQTADEFRSALLAIGSRPADVATAELALAPTSALPIAAPIPTAEARTGALPSAGESPPPAPAPPAGGTSLLPLPPSGNPAARDGAPAERPRTAPPASASGSGPRPASRYRRRRIAALAVLLILIAGAAAAVAALSRRGPTQATVPGVIGLAVADATAKVSQAGLKPQVVEQNRPGVAGRVADQQPRAGARVNTNTDVSLFVPATTTTTTPRSVTRPTTRATTTIQPAVTTTPPPTTTPAGTTPPATTLVPATTIPVPTT